MFALRVMGHHQHHGGRRQHEGQPDEGLLHCRPAPLDKVKTECAQQGAARGDDLYRKAVGLYLKHLRGDHPQAGNLRHGQINKDNAAFEHALPQRYMGQQHQQSR